MGTIRHHFNVAWAYEQFLRGASGDALGRHFGVAGNTVIRRMRMAGYFIAPKNKNIDLKALRRLHLTGMSHADLGEIFGMSAAGIARRLKKLGLKSWPRIRPKTAIQRALSELDKDEKER